MRIQKAFSVLLLAMAACSTSDDSTAVVTEASTTPAPTTVAPTTVAPTTVAPTTTAAVTTTGLPATTTSPPTSVAFATSGQVVLPVAFADPQLAGMVIHSDAAGDLEGALTSALVTLGGESVALVWFEGRVADCGEGGMAMRIATRPDATLGWEIVPGLGVGDLAATTGSGDEVAPNFTGAITCAGVVDPTALTTTLLAPVPTTGIEQSVPAHMPLKTTTFDVAPHPAQTAAPKMWINESVYDVWTSPQILLGTAFPGEADTPVRNAMVSLLTFAGPCEAPGVTRVFMEDVLYPEFRGAWDVPAATNNGATGAGHFDATEDVGRVICS
jgi:hypothetical protein